MAEIIQGEGSLAMGPDPGHPFSRVATAGRSKDPGNRGETTKAPGRIIRPSTHAPWIRQTTPLAAVIAAQVHMNDRRISRPP
jgi:hypothetical protein